MYELDITTCQALFVRCPLLLPGLLSTSKPGQKLGSRRHGYIYSTLTRLGPSGFASSSHSTGCSLGRINHQFKRTRSGSMQNNTCRTVLLALPNTLLVEDSCGSLMKVNIYKKTKETRGTYLEPCTIHGIILQTASQDKPSYDIKNGMQR